MKIRKLMLLLPIFIMVGCSTKITSETFQNTIDSNNVTTKIVADHKGNKIEKLTYEIVTPFSKLFVSTEDDAKKVMYDILKEYNSIEGVNAKAKYQNNTVIQKIEINKKNGLSNQTNDILFKNINFSDFKKYKENLLENGFENK